LLQVKNYISSKLKELQDWYITANDAVQLGLADAIFGTESCPNIECLK
jgi:ATP-dependent protease ClpP protease subunit